MYADPGALEQAARDIEARGRRLHEIAAHLESQRVTASWRGHRADEFARSLAGRRDEMSRAAEEMFALAAEVRRAAEQLRARIRQIHAIEHAALGWFRSAESELWQHWSWKPGRLPGAGSPAWLDVAPYLRAQGVPI